MLHRYRNARRASPGEDPLPRKTTEVRIERSQPGDTVNRAQTRVPALVLVEGELPGQVFRLHHGRQLIGRRPECEIRVRERAVSGLHAEVVRNGDTVTLTDLESTNGTLVDGVRIRKPVSLVPGNLVAVGKCVFRYIDSLLEVEFTEALQLRGITDQLTGAYNRAWLVNRLGFAIDSATPLRPVSLIAFDYDDFKLVNDRYGHAAGDAVLRESSALIASTMEREQALLARVGGEEFVLVMAGTALPAAAAAAERIRTLLAAHPFRFEGTEIRLTASFGVASATSSTGTPESLLARADELLYRSKREGRNRVSSDVPHP